FFAALAFIWLKLTGLYPPELRSLNIDAEWLYRRLAWRLALGIGGVVKRTDLAVRRVVLDGVGVAITAVRRYCGPDALVAQSWATGAATLWVAALLGATLVIYYIHGTV
ncbi:MAG: Na(+)/H(+) antiporter subunit D, partial [Alphaproteobacteria bacterium]